MTTIAPPPSSLDESLERARASLFLSLFRPIGHALNNPLQGALGAVELAALSGDAIEAVRGESLASAREEVLRAAGLVSALQRLARGVDEGPSTWAASFDRCAELAHALCHHAGLELDSAGADLSPQLVAPAAALDLAWLGIVDAHRRLGLARGTRVTLRSEQDAKRMRLCGPLPDGQLPLHPDLRAALDGLGFAWRVGPSGWSLDVGLVERT